VAVEDVQTSSVRHRMGKILQGGDGVDVDTHSLLYPTRTMSYHKAARANVQMPRKIPCINRLFSKKLESPKKYT
jgi:hypothetical protein